MCGRAGTLGEDGRWSNITYLPCTAANGFVPAIPDHRIDLIYLCYPNNPTGTTLTRDQLKQWVDYALANDTLIIFDAAYEAYIHDDDVPHSIYEIRGAKKVAIEIRSFSKTAGFTGVRCGYTVVPKEVTAATLDDERVPLNPLWNRRQCTKFNGTSYITQRGAEAVYSPEGRAQVKETIAYYMENARTMREGLTRAGYRVFGGINAPSAPAAKATCASPPSASARIARKPSGVSASSDISPQRHTEFLFIEYPQTSHVGAYRIRPEDIHVD